jgi:hypothetical protein
MHREQVNTMDSKSKLGAVLVVLGFILGALAVFAPVGAAAGRAPAFGVVAKFYQSGAETTAYDMDAGGSLVINLTITNTGDNATDANVTLRYSDDIMAVLNGVTLKSWDPVALDNDTPTLLSYEWAFPLILLYDINNSFIVNITAGAVDFPGTVIPLNVFTSNPLVDNVAAVSSNTNASLCVLGIDDVTTTITVSDNGNKDITDGNIEVSTNEGLGLGPSLGNITIASLKGGTSQDFVFKTNFSGVDISPGVHVMMATVTVGQATASEVSDEILLMPPIAVVAVDSLTCSPASAFEGAIVAFTAKLNSTGTVDATNQTLELWDGAASLGMVTGIDIPIGTTKDVPFNWTLPEVAADTTKTITAKVGDKTGAVNVTVLNRFPVILINSFTVPDGMKIGDAVNFSATIKNNGTGDAKGLVIEFYDNATKLGNTTAFDLAAGNTTTVTVKVALAGTADIGHTFFVKALGAEKNVTRTVAHQPVPASVGITSFTVKPAKKDKQPQDSTQSYTLTVVLKNSGELKSTNCTLTMKEGSKTINTEIVSLDGNATVTKTYTWKVKGSGGHTATAALTGADTGAPAAMNTKCTLEYTPGFEVLFLVAAIVVAAVLARRRKN